MTSRGERRKRATEEKIYRSVLEIAREEGFNAVTIDAVVAHSGVAKTTIYRRYSNRKDMLSDALSNVVIAIPLQYPATFDEFEAFLIELQDHLEKEIGIRLIGSLLSSRDDYVDEWRERLSKEVLQGLEYYVKKGIENGVFAPRVHPRILVSMVVGSIFVRSAFQYGDPKLHARQIAELLWPVLEGERPVH
ncbi:Transcriptional regulator, TetR family [Corynebacterium capitovis DSM 44611]|uniref:TetR/AcrR family transcriptional regulator n=1 Tax=Corynebacterium capitovis TaxID=131081 RepID=UPI00035D1ABB|nr:TetR family transcriptional regulator [Corynebacterium capitovis]WKD56643.1 Transcriptional regulator, TetR family [Corynebacterium capitovis DSM 44611]